MITLCTAKFTLKTLHFTPKVYRRVPHDSDHKQPLLPCTASTDLSVSWPPCSPWGTNLNLYEVKNTLIVTIVRGFNAQTAQSVSYTVEINFCATTWCKRVTSGQVFLQVLRFFSPLSIMPHSPSSTGYSYHMDKEGKAWGAFRKAVLFGKIG